MTKIPTKKILMSQFSKMKKKIDQICAKIKKDAVKHAGKRTILKEKKELLLLVGECNFISKELAKFHKKHR